MASDDPARRRNSSNNNPISIPLQNLDTNGSGAYDDGLGADLDRHASRRRTLSERGRALLRGRSTRSPDTRYSPLNVTSPPTDNAPRGASPMAIVTSPSGQQQRIPDEDDEAGISPVDPGAFQAAIGFAGLSFNAAPRATVEDDYEDDYDDTPPKRASRLDLPTLRTQPSTDSVGELEAVELSDGPEFFSPGGAYGGAYDDDMIPLTDTPSRRPQRSTLGAPTPDRPSDDRGRRPSTSGMSLRFLSRSSRRDVSSGSRLGDDLEAGGSELGRTSTSRTRSLSPSGVGSPLARTSTMLRKMSQRVVNVSHEPEVLEPMPRRRASTVHSGRPDSTPRPSTGGHISMDGHEPPGTPGAEKPSPPSTPVPEEIPDELPAIDRNPLRGNSFGIFPPESKLRRRLLELLVHPLFEPFMLLLIIAQTIILAVESAHDVYTNPRPAKWGHQWTDYALVAIFTVYTIEIVIKSIVSGLLFNPHEYSTIDRTVGLGQALKHKANNLFALHRKPTTRVRGDENPEIQVGPSIIRAFTAQQLPDDIKGGSRPAQKKRLAYRAFLRHSFNRLDFVAVVSFWISFILSVFTLESSSHVYVFRMMSCLRIVRLLGITSGTSVILTSLKRAAPTLLNVAFLIGFFWLLFGIIGVQSFKSSLRRTCVWNWDNAIASEEPYRLNEIDAFQFCGSWIAQNETKMPWITGSGGWGTTKPKGYTCPVGSFCVEGGNPYNGTVSFDNIFQSVELVFVVMTSNTFTDIMYYLLDSDYLAAALFFAFGIIILTFWLINLLIAVITSSFQVIREESRRSAFMADDHDPVEEDDKEEHHHHHAPQRRVSKIRKAYDRLHWAWITVIIFGLVTQALRHDTMHDDTAQLIDAVELGVTMILLLEIIMRFAADWRDFRHHRRNWVDLFLAVITAIIQLPIIRNSGRPYAWMTVFQILRIYRVVLAVKITRDLIMLVLRHVSGVLNLILFVFLLTFLAAIFACQLFRGELPMEDSAGNTLDVNFSTIYNAFTGMYQILSSENWTDIMYNVTRFDHVHNTAWIGAAFFILWFILANFIVLNMFIAVIQENFDVSEDQKRLQQVRMFLQSKELGGSHHGTLALSNIFKFGFVKRQDPLDFGSAATEMLLKDQVVKDFLDEQMEEISESPSRGLTHTATDAVRGTSGWLESWRDWIVKKLFHREPNPFYARLQLTKAFEELDPRTLAKEVVEATEQRKVIQREYLRKHPGYNKSLFIFGPYNPIRRFCQRIVGPGRGNERAEGVAPNPTIWYTFSAFVYCAIVAMVLLACITTPLYQKEYFESRGEFTVYNWFVFTDMGFAALFAVEAIIKVIADGFFWTPNAYFRSSWGFIDGIVLVTLWINVSTSLNDPGGGSRAVGAFKALRALRLLNVSDSARDTFHSVIILGGWKVASAAFVSLSLLIPFAIYGLNLFAGQMQECNDGGSGIFNLTDCVGEYMASPYNWEFPAPRQVANPYYDFDNFGGSLFILFQIVSQEGWIDVRNSAESITGVFTQPESFASQGNALFFVVFNLLGAVFVLTLFVSVFMRNYTEQTGVAFLTADQRSWLELRKLLRQVAPSKRPNNKKKREDWQEWCYRRAITKNGRWQRSMTGILVVHLILLCLEFYPTRDAWGHARDYIFLVFTLAYIANIVIRIIGLSWTRFRKSAWDVYSLFAVSGTFVTTILLLSNPLQREYAQGHKLFLVAVALLLIPRNNQLDQLFKTAAASFTSIANLLATWFVLFLVYAIAFTQAFGLTRFGSQETGNLNFRTVPKALILLFRTSVGEGWNEIMEDFAGAVWPYCTIGDRYFEGDCGSPEWARALFVSWNILSMYIFVNLFISLIYESFSYVYQRSSGLSIISREEIRRFKQAWAEFDPNGSGYISKEVFPRFLGELSGVFEMRIYDGDFSVRALIDDCRVSTRSSSLPVDGPSTATTIDIAKLNRRLAELPVDQIRRRRARMNTFYEEVLVSADPDRGISFNALLMILAHYKVINDNKSLKLEEFLRRRARLQRVEEAVNRNIVVGFFDTLYWARRFRRIKDGKKNARITEFTSPFGVPEIFVQDEGEETGVHPTTPKTPKTRLGVPSLSITPVEDSPDNFDDSIAGQSDMGSPSRASGSRDRSPSIQISEPETPWARHRSLSIQRPGSSNAAPESPRLSPGLDSPRLTPGFDSPRLTPHHQASPSGNINPDWHFAAGLENAAQGVSPPASPRLNPTTTEDSGDGTAGQRSRANSAVSQNDMLGLFQDSAWGQSVRRSFTTRRSDDRRPSS